jgi:hypothetical protein
MMSSLMKIYLAAWYERNAEMRLVRDELKGMGYEVTSRWIDQHAGELTESMNSGDIASNPAAAEEFALTDLRDIDDATMLIFFASPNGEGKGGRFVELGYAIASRKLIIHIGKRENVFCALSFIAHYETWDDAKASIFRAEERK